MFDIWPFNHKKEVDYLDFKNNINPKLLEALNEIRGHFAQKEDFCNKIRVCGYRFEEHINAVEPILINDYKNIAYIIKNNRSNTTKYAITYLKKLRSKYPHTSIANAIDTALEIISSNERILTRIMLNLISQEVLVKKLKRGTVGVIDFAAEFYKKFSEEKELFAKIFASHAKGERVAHIISEDRNPGILHHFRTKAATYLLMVMLGAMALSNTGCERWEEVKASYSQVEINTSIFEGIIRKVETEEPVFHQKTRDHSEYWSGEDIIILKFDNPMSRTLFDKYLRIEFEFKNDHCKYPGNHPQPLNKEMKAEMLKNLNALKGKPVKVTIARAVQFLEGHEMIGLEFSAID